MTQRGTASEITWRLGASASATRVRGSPDPERVRRDGSPQPRAPTSCKGDALSGEYETSKYAVSFGELEQACGSAVHRERALLNQHPQVGFDGHRCGNSVDRVLIRPLDRRSEHRLKGEGIQGEEVWVEAVEFV